MFYLINGIKPNYVLHDNKNLKCNRAIPINNIEFVIQILIRLISPVLLENVPC